MATLEAGRWTKYLRSGTSTPSTASTGAYIDTRGGLSITYELNSAKTAYNLSIVHKVQGKQNTSSAGVNWSSGYKTKVTSYVNNVQVGSYTGTPPSDSSTYQQVGTTNLGTKTYSVPLNSDGTCSVTIKCIASISDGSYPRNWQVTYTLPTVALASSITDNTSTSNYFDFGTDVTFTITRPNDSVTHTLTYTVGSTEYTIGTKIGTSCTYAFPISLINSYPNNESVTIPVTCTNSNGLTDTCNVRLKVPASYVPTCSLAIKDTGIVPTDWGIWLKSKSKINGIVSASGVAGSTIKSYSTTANGAPYYASSFETSFLNSSGNQTITTNVKDTRERYAYASQTINVVDYWSPTLSKFSVERCNDDGTLNDDGVYGKVKCNYSVAPCNNNNTKQLIVKYGDETKIFTLSDYSGSVEATTEQLFGNLDTSSNHNFEFYIQDYFSGYSYSFIMPPAFTTISYLAGGKGVSIGQIASKEGFHVHMKTELHDELKLSSGIVLDFEVVDEW